MSFELHKHSKIHSGKRNRKFRLLHSKKFVHSIDKWVMFIGIFSPLSSLPQIIEIIDNKSADGVSVITWSLYLVLAFFWLVYGIVHKEKAIIVNNAIWIFFEIVVVALTFIY